LSIRDVGANHADAADCQSQQAFLLIWVERIADNDIRRRFSRQQGNTVVRFLSRENGLIAQGCDFLTREVLVLKFGFLQANNVWLLVCQPCEQLRQADLE